jgi:hypothetical protein
MRFFCQELSGTFLIPDSPASPSRHLCLVADKCKHRTTPDAPSIRTVSPAPLAGLIIFRPLHSISLRSVGRKLPRTENTAVRRRCKIQKMVARLRPTRPAISRVTSSGQDMQLARAASHGQDIGNMVRCSACSPASAIGRGAFCQKRYAEIPSNRCRDNRT